MLEKRKRGPYYSGSTNLDFFGSENQEKRESVYMHVHGGENNIGQKNDPIQITDEIIQQSTQQSIFNSQKKEEIPLLKGKWAVYSLLYFSWIPFIFLMFKMCILPIFKNGILDYIQSQTHETRQQELKKKTDQFRLKRARK